jgi:acyl carrier protein
VTGQLTEGRAVGSDNAEPASRWSAEFEEILRRHLPLGNGSLEGSAILADLGLDSLATVSLVIELEEGLDISIPDDLLVPATFVSADALWSAVSSLLEGAPA